MIGIKRTLLIAATVFTTNVCAYALDGGTQAPAFDLPANSGSNISLQSLKGKVIYLDFWASWCAPCKKSLPWMNSLKQQFASARFEVVAINLDSDRKDAERLPAETSSKLTVLFDPQGETPERYHLRTMPSSFLIDESGKIVASFEGFDEGEQTEIEQRIKSLLGGKKS